MLVGINFLMVLAQNYIFVRCNGDTAWALKALSAPPLPVTSPPMCCLGVHLCECFVFARLYPLLLQQKLIKKKKSNILRPY